MHLYRTHTCNELRAAQAGQTARLSGWVFRKRDHGGILFIDLRDHYGHTQIVIHPSRSFFDALTHLKLESVVTVTGVVTPREPSTINPDLPTGEVELVADECAIESVAEQVPLYLAGEEDGNEELRLTYRFLDLRRERVHRNIVLRSRVISHLRRKMESLGFSEYQTPILTSSSPEGARDYLVPSRVHPGQFYALPQAPQLFKQLLMVAGFDRYFQIAPCFRDEDARADRSPGEFYQLDMEMSYVTQDDVFAVVEDVVASTFSSFSKLAVDAAPWVRIPYHESMLKYGSDKPDLRIPIEMSDVSEIFRNSGFNAFAGAVKSGAVVRAIPVRGIKSQPRSFFDKLVEHAKGLGSKGLAYLIWDGEAIKGPIQKFLAKTELDALTAAGGMRDGDVMFFVCDAAQQAARIGGDIRVKLGRDLGLVEPGVFRFCWIVDFPMFEKDAETGAIGFSHNPFSMPQGGMDALQNKDPLEIRAFQYDVVCNGVELSSGAIRNHSPDVMYKAFEIAGYSRAEVEARFSCLLNAFRFGAPPHGGIAPGVDRMVMLLAGEENIREIIAFPMNQKAQDLMMGAPAEVTEKQLRELHIQIRGQRKPDGAATAPAAPPVMQRIGLIANLVKPHATEALRRVARLAVEAGLEPLADAATVARVGDAGLRRCEVGEFATTVEAVVALGGDGTLLNAAHLIQGTGLPLMGLNIGSLGYLTSVGEGRFAEALACLHAGRFTVSPRATLATTILRTDGASEAVRMDALNDVVVSRGASGRLARIALALDGSPVTTYVCDGVIVATPTGSTAYSLSAGGPIILPEARALAISVICPHALGARPLMVADTAVVSLRVEAAHAPLLLSIDGADDFALAVGDRVEVRRSPCDVLVAFLPDHDPYAVLSRKLGWGGRVLHAG